MAKTEIKNCRWPWNRTYINANGDIKPCCYATLAVGNVMDGDDPAAVWAGRTMQELRRYITENRVHRVCAGAGCSFIRSRVPEGADLNAQIRYRDVPAGVVSPHLAALAGLGSRDAMYTLGAHLLTAAGPTPAVGSNNKAYGIIKRVVWLRASQAGRKWLRRAASAGSEGAAYTLGAHLYSVGTRVTDKMALGHIRKAADAGYPLASMFLARMYIDGRGVTQDYREAYKAAETAADGGEPSGYYLMGMIASHDPSRRGDARRLLELAKRRGVGGADDALAALEG